eukprot:448695-Pyramimonas_sp.AAC.1
MAIRCWGRRDMEPPRKKPDARLPWMSPSSTSRSPARPSSPMTGKPRRWGRTREVGAAVAVAVLYDMLSCFGRVPSFHLRFQAHALCRV